MPWKVNGEGVFELVNGNPVWVTETGEEKTVDYPAMSKKLSDANRESADRKEKIRTLEARYEALKDIEDFSAWLEETTKAREMLANAPKDKLALEEQIRARVDAATKPISDKLSNALKDADALRASLQAEKVTNAFSRSEYVQKNLVDPALAADLFASKFVLENGNLVAMGHDGKPLYGAEGVASFDEAIVQFVNASPYKSVLLKGSGASGSGGSSNHSGNHGSLVKNPWKQESFNVTEQNRIFIENPAQARAMMKEAGVYMPGL